MVFGIELDASQCKTRIYVNAGLGGWEFGKIRLGLLTGWVEVVEYNAPRRPMLRRGARRIFDNLVVPQRVKPADRDGRFAARRPASEANSQC